MKALTLALVALLLAGCSDGGGEKVEQQTRADCTGSQSFNEFESRCVSDFEACYAWINGNPDPDESVVTCQADSDGSAWLDWGFALKGTIHVKVRDGADVVVHESDIDNENDRAKLDGRSGVWHMSVDFSQATGSGEIYLWG